MGSANSRGIHRVFLAKLGIISFTFCSVSDKVILDTYPAAGKVPRKISACGRPRLFLSRGKNMVYGISLSLRRSVPVVESGGRPDIRRICPLRRNLAPARWPRKCCAGQTLWLHSQRYTMQKRENQRGI